jgi:1-acyl-sn-glycerol-3-phosphate acyltransferase
MTAMDAHAAHTRAREPGVSRPLYALVRLLVTPLLRFWFRVHIAGAEHLPKKGAAVIAANHKSFLDPFFLALSTRRHVRYMAKIELFRGPAGWLLLRLGAFPVRRGEADADAMETAQTILAQGGLVAMFPEGTRVDEPDALAAPHHGAGRLALEAGAPVIPAAISGTAHLWLGPLPKPRRVQVTFLSPVDMTGAGPGADAVTELVDNQVWPAVRQQYGRQLAKPGLIVGALAATGVGARLVARRERRAADLPRLVGKLEPRAIRRKRDRRRHARRLRAALRLRRVKR